MKEKMVIETIKEGKTIISASRENCDPFTRVVDGDINACLRECAGMTEITTTWEAALRKWETEPHNPAWVPPPKPAPEKKPKGKGKGKKAVDQIKEIQQKQGTQGTPEPKPEPKKLTPREKVLADLEKAQNGVDITKEKPVEDLPLFQQKDSGKESAGSAKEAYRRQAASQGIIPQGKIFLATGEGPFENLQGAFDALGLPADKRPNHNRYNRLSKDLQSKIVIK